MRTSILLLAALPLVSCGGAERAAGFQAALPAPVSLAQPQARDGAIFSAASGYAPLHYGIRAAKVGDIVTVRLVERTSTRKSARSKTQRDGGFGLTPPAVGPFAFDPGITNMGGDASFTGGGDAAQTSALDGDITVSIAEVLPSGLARIRGEKLLNLSQGEEWIQLSGIIRLADVDGDNTVPSHRIADARIAYSGKGDVQRSSRQGWLQRFFDTVSPF